MLLFLASGCGSLHAQSPASRFANFAGVDVIFPDPDGITLPGDGRPWVIVVFKACCATNRRAIRWALDAEKTYGDSIGVLGLNSDYARAISKVKPWLQACKVDFTVLQDPSHEIINALSIMAVPTIIILNSKGEEDFRSAGFFGGSGKVMDEHLRKILSSSALIPGDQYGK